LYSLTSSLDWDGGNSGLGGPILDGKNYTIV
jgi:hypothetical protein